MRAHISRGTERAFEAMNLALKRRAEGRDDACGPSIGLDQAMSPDKPSKVTPTSGPA